MESEGAVEVFARSAEARNLIYKTYVGDGDSKAYSAVRDSMPYEPLIYIEKEKCNSHITKSMGTDLRSIVKNYKGIHNLTYLIYSNIFLCIHT